MAIPSFSGLHPALEEELKLSSAYVRKDALELELTADDLAWQPCDIIRGQVDDFDKIEVELIDKDTKLSNVRQNMLESEDIGLIVMGSTIHRHSRPSLMVLATKDKLFVIDPDDLEKGVQFLRLILNDPRLQFYTTNGIQESDCLFHNYGINLAATQARCCTGLHIQIIRAMQCMPIAGRLYFTWPALVRCGRRVQIESFDELVEIWLDINKEFISIDAKQLAHLKTRPLDLTATNLIKKRCVLVRSLAKRLEYYSWTEFQTMSNNSFMRLIRPNSDKLREAILMGKESKEVDVGYFAHLNCGPS